jgi:hypothetical protein
MKFPFNQLLFRLLKLVNQIINESTLKEPIASHRLPSRQKTAQKRLMQTNSNPRRADSVQTASSFPNCTQSKLNLQRSFSFRELEGGNVHYPDNISRPVGNP